MLGSQHHRDDHGVTCAGIDSVLSAIVHAAPNRMGVHVRERSKSASSIKQIKGSFKAKEPESSLSVKLLYPWPRYQFYN
jgi:hypothetical protein